MIDVSTRQPVRERSVGPYTVVELHGEIDMLSAPTVTARLDVLTSAGQPLLVLDLRPVTFIDCGGLGVLCRVRRRTLRRGGKLRLVVDGHRIPRILRFVGLNRAFDLYATLPDALH
ncbi:STAS domain-containing protein [Streptomyces ferrugineus]|uniref:Anti-sigma factor antagonist n=1 Tax=Streptomyces ferrugineus TaxID=1413221 RepID=A0A7M2SDA3_9ACTN|nr:STAS domain-containing protein [Streptomyces ferrugineus]QOV33393.1 STAS domain-containing protein [Streptomyces ferrugineus]